VGVGKSSARVGVRILLFLPAPQKTISGISYEITLLASRRAAPLCVLRSGLITTVHPFCNALLKLCHLLLCAVEWSTMGNIDLIAVRVARIALKAELVALEVRVGGCLKELGYQ
jgi:hypothetical protein